MYFTLLLGYCTSKLEKIEWAKGSVVGSENRVSWESLEASEKEAGKPVRKRQGRQQSPSSVAAALVAPGKEMGLLSSFFTRPTVLGSRDPSCSSGVS